MINNSLKAVVVGSPLFQKDVNGNEHFFLTGKSGSLIHIAPHLGKCRLVKQTANENEYFTLGYASLNNCYYFSGYPLMTNQLGEYNPITGEVKYYEVYFHAGAGSRDRVFQGVINYDFENYINELSDDGHLWLSAYKLSGLYGAFRFNVLTKQIDNVFEMPDREFNHLHGRQDIPAYYIESGTLTGVYSAYLYNDSFEFIKSTIDAEIVTSGLLFNNDRPILLNYEDRDVASTKRRVFAVIGGSWRIVDLKDTSNYIDSQQTASSTVGTAYAAAWIDNVGAGVSKTNWTSGTLETYAGTTGMVVPTYNASFAYSKARKIGRFTYIGFVYMANKTYFYTFAIHPTTGEALYPNAFDKTTTFLHNTWRIYKCNFGGVQGFSSDDERVAFITNSSGSWGYYRPDTNAWTAYDPVANPSGYVIRQILNEETDPDGLGILFAGRFENGQDVEINGNQWKTNSLTGYKSALNVQPIQSINPDKNLADLTWEVLLDKENPDSIVTMSLEKLRTGFGIPTQSFLIDSNSKLLVFGSIYSGVSLSTLVDKNNITNLDYIAADPISYNGAIRINSALWIGYGYLGKNHFVTVSGNSISIDRIGTVDVTEPRYVTVHNSYFIFGGDKVRESAVKNAGWFSANHLTNKTTHSLTNQTHDKINGNLAVSIRNKYALSAPGYTDAQVEDAIQAYIASEGVTRQSIIDEFLSGPEYRYGGIEVYGNKCIVSPRYAGHPSLAGIRIETTPGSGTWVTSTSNPTYNYPICFYFDVSDILALTPADWKIVELQLTAKSGELSIGQVGLSTNYVFFFDADTTTGANATVYKTTKALLETAASGAGILGDSDFTSVAIPDNLGDERFQHGGTHQSNFFQVVGDTIYFTVKSNGNAVYKLDLTTDTLTLFATLAGDLPKSIDIYGNDMLVSTGTEIYLIQNYAGVVTPYALT